MELIMYICIGIIVLLAMGALVGWLWNRALGNGASVTQVMVGKKIGEICTSNAMCGTNKCVRNICVI